jgi:hypothetical protein
MCGAIFAGLLWKFFGYSLAVSLIAVFIVAIPLTFVIFYFLLNGEKNSKFGKLHTEFLQELVKNGYSDRFLAITEEAVAANRNGEKVGKVYLRDFVLYACDYYNLTGNHNKALQLLSNLNEFDYTGNSDTFIDQGSSAIMYYSALMDAYRGLNDKYSGSTLVGRAAKFLNRNYKNEILNMGVEGFYYTYSMLIEDYETAGAYVQKLNSHTSALADKYFVRYFYEADYYAHFGRKDEAITALKKMEPLIAKGGDLKRAMEFCYNCYWDMLGLREQKQG